MFSYTTLGSGYCLTPFLLTCDRLSTSPSSVSNIVSHSGFFGFSFKFRKSLEYDEKLGAGLFTKEGGKVAINLNYSSL